jgi:hypothetical protein
VRCISRITFSAFAVALVATVAGCACKWTREEGLCLKPLFRIHVELNRFEDTHGGEDCCIDGAVMPGGAIPGGVLPGGVVPGGVIDPGFVEGGGHVAPGGFATSGPLTVETEPLGGPLGAPILPPVGSAVAGGFLSGSPNTAPVFGPNANLQSTQTPPASTSGGTQQTAKKRPGSLNVKTGLQLDHAQPGGVSPSSSLRVGQRTVFGVIIENQGDAAIETTQLQGVFTNNLKPISVIRSSGPAVDQLRQATTSARIEGQRVIFDKFDQFGPETKHEYQITAEITAAGPGNFEVTEIAGPVVKKNTPITASAQ